MLSEAFRQCRHILDPVSLQHALARADLASSASRQESELDSELVQECAGRVERGHAEDKQVLTSREHGKPMRLPDLSALRVLRRGCSRRQSWHGQVAGWAPPPPKDSTARPATILARSRIKRRVGASPAPLARPTAMGKKEKRKRKGTRNCWNAGSLAT